MIFGATKVSEGIKKGGKYIKSKVTKDEKEAEFSESTKQKIKIAKATTKSVFEFGSIAVKGLVVMAKSIGT